jgi:hypothetical protein
MSDCDMTEQGYNNTSAGDFEEADQLDDEFIPDDARPLCLKCLKPCHPLQHYCDSCDCNDAINPLTPYMPFLNIRFNYGIFITMWRKIWYEKYTSIIVRVSYLFMITMFVPVFLVVGLPSFLIVEIPQSVRKTTIIALFIIGIVLLIFFWHYRLFTGLVSGPIRITVR